VDTYILDSSLHHVCTILETGILQIKMELLMSVGDEVHVTATALNFSTKVGFSTFRVQNCDMTQKS